MRLVRAVLISGNLTVTIPRALCREIGWLPGAYISIRRGPGRAVLLEEARLVHADDAAVPEHQPRLD